MKETTTTTTKNYTLQEVESILIDTLKKLASAKDYETLKSGKKIATACNVEGLNFGTPKILSSGAKDTRFFDYKGTFLPKRLHNYYNAAFGTQSVTDLEATNNGNVSIYSNDIKRVRTINRKEKKSCTTLLDELFAAFIERGKQIDIEYNGKDSIKVFAAKIDQKEQAQKEQAQKEQESKRAQKLENKLKGYNVEDIEKYLNTLKAAANA